MLIACPTCATSYEVAEASLMPSGRSVRCTRCKEIWFATADAPAMADAADEGWGEAGLGTGDAETAQPPPSPTQTAAFDAGGVDADWAAALNEQVGADADQAPAFAADLTAEIPAADAPTLVPHSPDEPPSAETANADSALQEDIETVASRRLQRGGGSRRRGLRLILPVLIVALIGINAALIIWRTNVVRALPQTASLYAAIGLPVNLRGLEFANVTVTRDQHEGVSVLIVEGLILSVAKTPVDVPRLRLAVRNESGAEVYTWTARPTRSILGAGEQLPFRSRLASPPADGRDVMVRFFNRHDLPTVTR
jgi:predicted Zn finger-like uncharacterized protein